MGGALIEFELRLDETLAAAHFMDRAYRLRPRIGNVIRWEGPPHEIEMARGFMSDDSSREEEVLSALLIRTSAAFERYVRKACTEAIEARAASASAKSSLPEDLKRRNLILSSRLLASLEQPRDHISFDPRRIVENLAACENNQTPYQLNSVAFSASLQSPTVEAVNKIFASVGLNDVFEELGRFAAMQQHLNTQDTRATNKRVAERLTEIVRWRNNLAHAGDDERTITIDQLDSIIEFVRIMARGIDEALQLRISRGFS